MASSSPLSDPPSSPPRSPSCDRSRKRGSYDPSTSRTARRLKSAERSAFDFNVQPVKAAMEPPAARGRPATSSRSKSIFDSMPKETVQAEKSALFSIPSAPKKSTATKPTAGQPANTTPPGGKGGGQERASLVASAVFGSMQTKNDRSLFPVPNPTTLQTDKSLSTVTHPYPRAQSAMGSYETGGRIGSDSDESQLTTPTPLAKTM